MTERLQRLLRLARLRGDRVAIATLTHDRRYVPEPGPCRMLREASFNEWQRRGYATETELRALWGDR